MFRPITVCAIALPSLLTASCIDTAHLATKTTAKVLAKAQPSLNEESDYEHAGRAIPGALKTVEGFHVAYPDITDLTKILAQGYCQYGTGFVEDEWEVAQFEQKDFEKADYEAGRATKMYIRCMNYGLELLGSKWTTAYTGNADDWKAMARTAGAGKRTPMMWAAIGLASAINMNKDDVGMISMLPVAEWTLKRVVVMDGDGAMIKPADMSQADFDKEFGKALGSAPKNPVLRAMPHIALGMLYTSRGKALGGDPEMGKKEFERAIELTGGKFLLAKVLLARNYGRIQTNREFFRKTLVEVLQTDPAIYPEQRLANEIAQRRARRYLKMEKEWF